MSTHPQLHPQLNNFSFFTTLSRLISSEEVAVSFLQEIKLLPSQISPPPLCCGSPMKVEGHSGKKMGWIWRCSTKASKKKGSKQCRKTENPSAGTLFDGNCCRIKINEVLAIIMCFVGKMPVTWTHQQLQRQRLENGESELSCNTVVDYYSYCREVTEVIASHSDIVLGGQGKTVQIDETFLTKRKYNRGRMTEQMTITVLGLYCKEDKEGLFFKVNSKKKSDLWPYIQKYIDRYTSRICTDSAKQYCGVEKLFSKETVHLQTNHSKGEYVEKNNPINTINDLENQNKQLKRAIVCRRTPKLLHQYMALHFYRCHHLEKEFKHHLGSQIMQFLLDIHQVYPGIVDGERREGLQLLEIDAPTQISDENEHLTDCCKNPRMMTVDEEIEVADSSEDDQDVHFESFGPTSPQ